MLQTDLYSLGNKTCLTHSWDQQKPLGLGGALAKMNAVSVPWSHPRTTRQTSVGILCEVKNGHMVSFVVVVFVVLPSEKQTLF